MTEWKSDLESFYQNKDQKEKEKVEKSEWYEQEAQKFFNTIVIPAFEEIRQELEKYQRRVVIHIGQQSVSIAVAFEGNQELDYSIKVNPNSRHPYPSTRFKSEDGKMYRAEGTLRSGAQDYTIDDITKEEIIKDFLFNYKLHLSKS